MKRIIPLVLSALLLACPAAWAADVTAALDINSAYLWRGLTVNDGLVLQPSIDVAKNGFDFNVWGNFDIGDYDNTLDPNNFSEVDLTLSYGFSIQKLEVGVGVIEYLFPATIDTSIPGTREIYLTLGYPIIGGLSAGLGIYHDVDEAHGYYTDLSLTYAMDLNAKTGLEIGAKIAYVDDKYAEFYNAVDGTEEGGLNDYAAYVSLSYTVTDALSLSASVTAVGSLSEDTLPDEKVDKNMVVGVGVSYAF